MLVKVHKDKEQIVGKVQGVSYDIYDGDFIGTYTLKGLINTRLFIEQQLKEVNEKIELLKDYEDGNR